MIKLLPLLAFGLLTACQSTNVSKLSSPLESTIKSPLCADIAVGEIIAGEDSSITLFNVLTFGPSKFVDGVNYGVGGGLVPDTNAKVKAAAAYNALMGAGADVIVAPRYTIDTTNYFIFKTTTAMVEGNSGVIRSIQNSERCTSNQTSAMPTMPFVESAQPAPDRGRYVIQLMGTGTEAGAVELKAAHPQIGDIQHFRTQLNGKTWYVVVQGDYPSFEAARTAIGTLPAALRQKGPFPRALSDITARAQE